MNKLDYDEQFEETEEEIRAREAKRGKGGHKESGRSVYNIKERIASKGSVPPSQNDNNN